jgi:hypothetical protein
MVEKDGRIYLRRVSMNLPEPLLIDVQELALKLRRSGTQVSLSARRPRQRRGHRAQTRCKRAAKRERS